MSKLEKYQNAAMKRGGILLSTSVNSNRKLKWQCKDGHIFWLTGKKVMRGKFCMTCGASIGERNIRAVLQELNLPFSQQYILPNLKRRKYDFYFEYNQRKYLIEYDGEQHFSYVRKYHKTKAKFLEAQVIDRIKTYCPWQINYNLIRIDYTQVNNVKYHIINAIKSGQIVYLSNPEMYKYITDVNITQTQFQQFI